MIVRHQNNGSCPKCLKIFDLYPGFYEPLKQWFLCIQKDTPEAHISDAGRGKLRQEQYFKDKRSNARWGQSAHNYNAAIDIFRIMPDKQASWREIWYQQYIEPKITKDLMWGGWWKSFKESPHVEVKDWKKMVSNGQLKLVE